MRIVKLKGGLGNQMFQYAFALYLKKQTGDQVKVDISTFAFDTKDVVRMPRIKKYNLSLDYVSEQECKQILHFSHRGVLSSPIDKIKIIAEIVINRKFLFVNRQIFMPMARLEKYKYYDGYWQSYKYVDKVKNELQKDFLPKERLSDNTINTISEVKSQNSVFVGIRKGDYLAEKDHYGIFTQEYYHSCMEYITKHVENPIFYIFSNDIDWCKNNMDWNGFSVRFREKEMQTDDFEELQIMASCQHAIIINSTYHWWGAYLIENSKKIICCPKKWFLDGSPDKDICPSEWVRI